MSENSDETPARGKRKRVVLSDAGNPVTVLRTISELEQQTSIGEVLVRNLVRAQLRAAVGIAGLLLIAFAAVPTVALLVPGFASLTVFGVPVHWVILGVVPFPLLFIAGYLYNWLAERNERDFVAMVEN